MHRYHPINIAIVEDDQPYGQQLQIILSGFPVNLCAAFRCEHLYFSAEKALDELPSHKPDVVITDLNLPGMSGIEFIKALNRQRPDTEFLVLTVDHHPATIFEALEAGATGYIIKAEASPAAVLAAVRTVHQKGSVLSSQVARLVIEDFHRKGHDKVRLEILTKREMQILKRLAEGDSNKEIAAHFDIEVSTVRSHVHSVLSKLHARSRAEAARFFRP